MRALPLQVLPESTHRKQSHTCVATRSRQARSGQTLAISPQKHMLQFQERTLPGFLEGRVGIGPVKLKTIYRLQEWYLAQAPAIDG
eukprot:1157551-Pelagomonas_calceolata.AAC.4